MKCMAHHLINSNPVFLTAFLAGCGLCDRTMPTAQVSTPASPREAFPTTEPDPLGLLRPGMTVKEAEAALRWPSDWPTTGMGTLGAEHVNLIAPPAHPDRWIWLEFSGLKLTGWALLPVPAADISAREASR